MTLHGEAFWLLNLGMDFLCVMGTARYLGLPQKPLRMALAAILGATYSLAALGNWALGGLGGMLFASFCMGAVAFGRHLIRGASGIWIIGLCTSGLASIAGRYLPRDWAVLMVCAVFALSFCFVPPKGRRTTVQRGNVRFVWQGREVCLPAIVDTGNLLRDRLTGLPVIVAPVKMCPQLAGGDGRGMRFIRAHTASGSALLPCFHPEQTVLTVAGKARQLDAVVALAPGVLPGALVPSDLVKQME